MSVNFDLWHKQPPTPCQPIVMLGVNLVVKRDDLNHQVVQGNKLRKLKYNLIQAAKAKHTAVLTFGGAYSNHLLATAFAAKACGFKAIGIVRGNELANNQSVWSETLFQCEKLGMELVFVSRSAYRMKEQATTVQELLSQPDPPYLIPEGGSNRLAAKGMAEIVTEINQQVAWPTHIICPVGTGGTLTGLVQGVAQLQKPCQVIGVSVLKGLHTVNNDINQWLNETEKQPTWQVLDDYHCGGYAKSTPELMRFAVTFEQQHDIKLDKIYNSKSFYALAQLIQQGKITSSDRPLIIHTGGLQGGSF